jgi:hypothetical protein
MEIRVHHAVTGGNTGFGPAGRGFDDFRVSVDRRGLRVCPSSAKKAGHDRFASEGVGNVLDARICRPGMRVSGNTHRLLEGIGEITSAGDLAWPSLAAGFPPSALSGRGVGVGRLN